MVHLTMSQINFQIVLSIKFVTSKIFDVPAKKHVHQRFLLETNYILSTVWKFCFCRITRGYMYYNMVGDHKAPVNLNDIILYGLSQLGYYILRRNFRQPVNLVLLVYMSTMSVCFYIYRYIIFRNNFQWKMS